MNFRTRPHFEDRQIVQYLDENITLSGITNIAPIVLNFSGTTTAETAVTISELTGYLQGSKLSGFVVQPPILLQSGTTATTTTNVENFVLKALDQYGSVGWAPISGVSWSVSACTSPLNVTNIVSCTPGGTVYFTAGDVEFGTANVGINVSPPTNELHVVGSIRMEDGNEQNGYILTSDALGVGSWQILPGSSSASCITDLWVTNIHGCSPITIWDSVQSIGSLATGTTSFALGIGNLASGIASFAEGGNTTANGPASHSEGSGTLADGDASHAEGYQTIALGDYSHVEGWQTLASGNFGSHAEGFLTIASGTTSHSEGRSTVAGGSNSHAEGNSTKAYGSDSHSEGSNTIAIGTGSHAEGSNTIASGITSHAEGSFTAAIGHYSHAEGLQTLASGNSSHSEGYDTVSIGDYSHAEGELSTTYGSHSHAEGTSITFGSFSHSQNYNTRTYGTNSHAGGDNSIASGNTSFIHSTNSLVTGNRSAILGGQNITGTTDDTVYVPYLNISNLSVGVPINNLGIDSSGNVVVGTSGSGSTTGIFSGITILNITTGTSVSILGITSGGTIVDGSDLYGDICSYCSDVVSGDTFISTGITETNIINVDSSTIGSNSPYTCTLWCYYKGGTQIGSTTNYEEALKYEVNGYVIRCCDGNSVDGGTNFGTSISGQTTTSGATGPIVITGLTKPYTINRTKKIALLNTHKSDILSSNQVVISNSILGRIELSTLSSIDTSFNSKIYNSYLTSVISSENAFIKDSGISSIIASQYSTLSGVTGSTIIGGNNIVGTSSDTVYVPNLNIKTLGGGTAINNLGIDSGGNVVTGTVGGGIPAATTATTTTINFSGQTIYYNAGTPGTGNITGDLTGSKLGLIQKIYHNDVAEPTYPAGWVLMGDAIYFTSTLNIIYAEWAGGTRVEYWYVQEQ
jgi:hypothetical protein